MLSFFGCNLHPIPPLHLWLKTPKNDLFIKYLLDPCKYFPCQQLQVGLRFIFILLIYTIYSNQRLFSMTLHTRYSTGTRNTWNTRVLFVIHFFPFYLIIHIYSFFPFLYPFFLSFSFPSMYLFFLYLFSFCFSSLFCALYSYWLKYGREVMQDMISDIFTLQMQMCVIPKELRKLSILVREGKKRRAKLHTTSFRRRCNCFVPQQW